MLETNFTKLRANLELTPSFAEIVRARHAAIRSAIHCESSKLVGSLQRQTRIQPAPGGEFDVDILIVLGQFDRWMPTGGITAAAAIQDLYSRVQESDRYSKKDPQQDAPVVTLQFANNVVIELIPAYRDNIGTTIGGATYSPKNRAYWIPKNGTWELADYDYDAQYITNTNLGCGGYLVPAIKMLKSIKRIHFSSLNSFALEILAARWIPAIVEYQRARDLPVTYPSIIELFFSNASKSFAEPLLAPGSLSSPIHLTNEILQLQSIFTAISAHIQKTIEQNYSQQPSGWRVLFGDTFPATI